MKTLQEIIKKETKKIIPLALAFSLTSCGNFDRGTYQIENSKINYQTSKFWGDPKIIEIQNDGDTLIYEGHELFLEYKLEKFELNGEKYDESNKQYYPKIWNKAEERLNYLIPELKSILKEEYSQKRKETINRIESNN